MVVMSSTVYFLPFLLIVGGVGGVVFSIMGELGFRLLKPNYPLFVKIVNSHLTYHFHFVQIPVIFNALGGILVGLVTSYAGGVRKVSLTLLSMDDFLYRCMEQ